MPSLDDMCAYLGVKNDIGEVLEGDNVDVQTNILLLVKRRLRYVRYCGKFKGDRTERCSFLLYDRPKPKTPE